jgi:hypothetical protein
VLNEVADLGQGLEASPQDGGEVAPERFTEGQASRLLGHLMEHVADGALGRLFIEEAGQDAIFIR